MPGRKSPFSNVYSRQPMLAFGLSPMDLASARSNMRQTPFVPRTSAVPPAPPMSGFRAFLSNKRVTKPSRRSLPQRTMVKGKKKTTKCKKGREVNPKTGRCVKKCGRRSTRSSTTGRCVKNVCKRVCTPATQRVRKDSPVTAELKSTFNRLLSTYGENIALKGGVTEKRLPSWVRFPSKIRGMPKKFSKVESMQRVASLLSVCKRNGISLLDSKGKFFKTFGTLRSECKYRVRPQVMERVEKRMGLTPAAVRARYGPLQVVEGMGMAGKMKTEFGAPSFRRLAAFGAPAKKRSSRKASAKKSVPRPSAAVRRMCKKMGVKITMKRGSKRVYKSEKVLKAQCKKKMMMMKRKAATKRRAGFGKKRRSDSGRKSYFGLW